MRAVSLHGLPLAALLVALLGGCVTTSPNPGTNTNVPSPTEVSPVPVVELRPPLLYYAWLRQASEDELLAERKRLESQDPGEDAFMVALRHGLLLLATGIQNGQREAAVLAGLEGGAASAQLEENRVLGTLVSTQLRLRRQLLGASQQSGTNTIANTELERLRAENGRLQEQIDALTSIEQQLLERELRDAHMRGEP